MKLLTKLTHSLVFSILFSACGGGGDQASSPTATIQTTTVSIQNERINRFDNNVEINQSVELFLYFPETTLTNIVWRQVSGEPVTFLTPNSKAIAFTPYIAGNYVFEASFTKANGENEVLTHELEVSNTTSNISARLGHVVSEQGEVSLRVNLGSSITTNSITWLQTSGPTISFSESNSGQTAIFFDAPSVEQDTFVIFDVSASDGTNTFTDNIAVLIENKAEINNNAIFDERVADTFVYHTNSPYKDSLVSCVYSNELTVNTICDLNTLPLIAHDTLTPTVENIMDRVIVSHQWMGDRFKAFLEEYDTHDDFKNMLRATTAIVISYDVRPSFYWAATGAIYLDADNFWLSVDERDTLNEAPDYRSGFGSDLQFAMPWRYVKDNNYLSTYISEDTRRSRDITENVFSIISLMYHELAHANDFFPKSRWLTLDRSKQIIETIPNLIQSDLLSLIHPLTGDEMRSLAQVNFHGNTATPTQQSYTTQDISNFFSVESAPQFYNYSSTREDYAMLFDGFMMKARYDIDRDVAVTNYVGEEGFSSDYIVDWGQRGRISDDTIKPRVSYVVEGVLPEFDSYQTILDNLPAPIMMESGKSWIENLDISPTPLNKSSITSKISTQETTNNINRPINEINHHFIEKALPKK